MNNQLELYKKVLNDKQLVMLIKELATKNTERGTAMAEALQKHLDGNLAR